MYYKSKKISLLILVIASLVLSRALFFFINDPEGPNLLVVTGMAAIIFFLSLALQYLSIWPVTGAKRLVITIVIQTIITAGFLLFLR